MSELAGKHWAVISARGCEAMSLAYTEAVQYAGKLRGEKISGLCVITDAAAHRLSQTHEGNGRTLAQTTPRRKSSRRKPKNS